jgi:hypothetical protein
MDDAYLSKLSVDQPGLKPEFKKETLNYFIQVASKIQILNIQATASDKGASFSIKNLANNSFGEECKLNDGENKIQIECTSEDGTIKKYFIDCFKLLASSAQLNSLELSLEFNLKPLFEPNIFEYETNTKYACKEVNLKTNVIDPECTIEIMCNNKALTYNQQNNVCLLNYGFSEIQIKLTSPNKATIQVYKIIINRDLFPRLTSFLNIKDKYELEDSISLGALSRSYTTNDLNYSFLFLNFMQKISNHDDVLNIFNSLNNNFGFNLNLENKISDSFIRVPYLNGSKCIGVYS